MQTSVLERMKILSLFTEDVVSIAFFSSEVKALSMKFLVLSVSYPLSHLLRDDVSHVWDVAVVLYFWSSSALSARSSAFPSFTSRTLHFIGSYLK